MGSTAQETGSRFTLLADTSFLSLPVFVSIRDGGMEETVPTGPLAAGRPTDTCCDTHRDCECIWWPSSGRLHYIGIMARRNEF
jgi:hypothetical protein